MASSPEANRLTEAHRRAQNRLGALTVQQMRSAWRLLDFDDLDGSTPDWLRVAVPIVRSQARASSSLAATYYVQFRAFELGLQGGRFTPTLALPPASEAIATSLTVTGPVSVKKAMTAGRTGQQAMTLAEARSAAAGMRQALAGGRETVMRSMRADRAALGYARSASGSACAFCATLAGRGPVYSKDSADFESHDGCGCSAEPVFSRDAAWPAGSRRYQEIYNVHAKGTSDPLNAMRRALADAE